MAKKVLFVLTSNSSLGETGKPTGYHLREAAAPWAILKDAGYEIDFASPKGEHAPIDPGSMDRDDPVNRRFLHEAKSDIDNTTALEHVDAGKYDAVYIAGGHGAMWDLA
ncbi:MAG TPA: type 1 glutamine amidotransferase domain-containing protein, partial [Gammaproteobacteria bacterium]